MLASGCGRGRARAKGFGGASRSRGTSLEGASRANSGCALILRLPASRELGKGAPLGRAVETWAEAELGDRRCPRCARGERRRPLPRARPECPAERDERAPPAGGGGVWAVLPAAPSEARGVGSAQPARRGAPRPRRGVQAAFPGAVPLPGLPPGAGGDVRTPYPAPASGDPGRSAAGLEACRALAPGAWTCAPAGPRGGQPPDLRPGAVAAAKPPPALHFRALFLLMLLPVIQPERGFF